MFRHTVGPASIKLAGDCPHLSDVLVITPAHPPPSGCSSGFMTMWSSCFNPSSGSESTPHSLGSCGSLPAPDTPMLSAASLLSAHSSKSLGGTLHPEAPSSDDPSPPWCESGGDGCDDTSQGSGGGLDALMSESPRASSSSKSQFGAEHGEPDCQLVGHGWKLEAHKHVLKS